MDSKIHWCEERGKSEVPRRLRCQPSAQAAAIFVSSLFCLKL